MALIEKSAKMYGGTCINVGCIPTKSLVHSAGNAASRCIEKSIAYVNAVARKTQLVERLRLKNYKKLDTNPNITIIDGTARFISDHKVEVQRVDGVLVLESERFFINTDLHHLFHLFRGSREIRMSISAKIFWIRRRFPNAW